MANTSIPQSLPDDISYALEAYADFYWQQDQGFGDQVFAAEKRWISAKADLIAWCKRQKVLKRKAAK